MLLRHLGFSIHTSRRRSTSVFEIMLSFLRRGDSFRHWKSAESPGSDGTEALPVIASPGVTSGVTSDKGLNGGTLPTVHEDGRTSEKGPRGDNGCHGHLRSSSLSTPRLSLNVVRSFLEEVQFDIVEKWVFCNIQDKMGIMFNDRLPIGRSPSSLGPKSDIKPDSVRLFGGSVGLDNALNAAWEAGTRSDHINLGKGGMAGRVATSCVPEMHPDISTDEAFYRVDLARQLNIKGAVAVPLVRNNEGGAHTVIIFYARRSIDVDPNLADDLLRACVRINLSAHIKAVAQHDLDAMTSPRRRIFIPTNDSNRVHSPRQPSNAADRPSSLVASPPPKEAQQRPNSSLLRARLHPNVPILNISSAFNGEVGPSSAAAAATAAVSTSSPPPATATSATETDQARRFVDMEQTVTELQQTVADLRQELTLLTDMVMATQAAQKALSPS